MRIAKMAPLLCLTRISAIASKQGSSCPTLTLNQSFIVTWTTNKCLISFKTVQNFWEISIQYIRSAKLEVNFEHDLDLDLDLKLWVLQLISEIYFCRFPPIFPVPSILPSSGTVRFRSLNTYKCVFLH